MKRTALLAGAIVLAILSLAACSKKTTESGASGQAAGGATAVGAVSGQSEEARGRGWLEVQDADFAGHEIRKAGSAEKVAQADSLNSRVELEAGRYEVVFGRSVWKDVEVKAGVTTRLVPGRITLVGASLDGHEVDDAGTGMVQGALSSLKDSMTLVPGKYLVKFGPLDWPVEVEAGRTTVLTASVVEVRGADIQGHPIRTAAGLVVGEVSATQSSMPLPPGEYVIEIGGRSFPFTLKERERKTFERK
jgi:hypothetical protein